MYYKRNEPFRYTFGQPVEAVIESFIQDEEQELISNGQWEASILDISPSGMKIVSSANITPSEDLQIHVSFTLNETQLEMHGNISWKKSLGQHFEYGILENNSSQIKDVLISELKVYSKSHSQKR